MTYHSGRSTESVRRHVGAELGLDYARVPVGPGDSSVVVSQSQFIATARID